jgi:hypothetical protein
MLRVGTITAWKAEIKRGQKHPSKGRGATQTDRTAGQTQIRDLLVLFQFN